MDLAQPWGAPPTGLHPLREGPRPRPRPRSLQVRRAPPDRQRGAGRRSSRAPLRPVHSRTGHAGVRGGAARHGRCDLRPHRACMTRAEDVGGCPGAARGGAGGAADGAIMTIGDIDVAQSVHRVPGVPELWHPVSAARSSPRRAARAQAAMVQVPPLPEARDERGSLPAGARGRRRARLISRTASRFGALVVGPPSGTGPRASSPAAQAGRSPRLPSPRHEFGFASSTDPVQYSGATSQPLRWPGASRGFATARTIRFATFERTLHLVTGSGDDVRPFCGSWESGPEPAGPARVVTCPACLRRLRDLLEALYLGAREATSGETSA